MLLIMKLNGAVQSVKTKIGFMTMIKKKIGKQSSDDLHLF